MRACARALPGTRRRLTSASTTLNASEAAKFRGIDWNGAEGAALAAMHRTRMGALEQFLGDRGVAQRGRLEGVKMLDVGCGGGMLSQSLVELGADVTAIDAVEENVAFTADKVAAVVETCGGKFQGKHCTVEQLLDQVGPNAFDVVVSLEVIEHVDNQALFVDSMCKLSRNALALSTLNRTVKSYALAILAAEYVTGMVPIGTHDWFKFVRPEEIENVVHANSLHTDRLVGLVFNPLSRTWHCSSWETDANYMLFASR